MQRGSQKKKKEFSSSFFYFHVYHQLSSKETFCLTGMKGKDGTVMYFIKEESQSVCVVDVAML